MIFVVRGIELIAHLEYFDTATNAWSLVPTNQPLAPNTKYKYSMRAGNEGCGSCENVYVKNVEFVVNRSSYDIKFFTDETYRVLLSFNMSQFRKLGDWFSPFLEIKISPVVKSLNHYLFSSFSRENDKRKLRKFSTYRF